MIILHFEKIIPSQIAILHLTKDQDYGHFEIFRFNIRDKDQFMENSIPKFDLYLILINNGVENLHIN